jgi:TolB-like protein
MHVRVAIVIAACAVASLAGRPAAAAEGDARVVVAPVTTLGSETESKETEAVGERIAAAIGEVPGFAAVPDKEMRRAVKKARRPQLRACDGDAACLAELGKLLDARYVVSGELGGLGDAQLLAIEVVDVEAGRELRSTTAQLGSADDDARARAAMYQLLAPQLYIGSLELAIDIDGATIFLDGDKVGASPAAPIRAEVGNHALRITHPEYRDYVRFVDIPFGEPTRLDVGMKAFPIVEDEMRQHGKGGGPLDTGPRRRGATPWYKRWYTIAGAGAIVFIGSAVIVGLAADGIDADREEVVGE